MSARTPNPQAIMCRVSIARISVRVQASARREELTVRDRALVVRVTAPALDGRANRAVCRLLSKHLGVAPSRITIVRGERSREKLIEVEGLEQAALTAALRR
jgi:uncharacterized protein